MVKAPGAGFDYGAAAVGAGAVPIVVLITAAGLAVRRRRQPQFG